MGDFCDGGISVMGDFCVYDTGPSRHSSNSSSRQVNYSNLPKAVRTVSRVDKDWLSIGCHGDKLKPSFCQYLGVGGSFFKFFTMTDSTVNGHGTNKDVGRDFSLLKLAAMCNGDPFISLPRPDHLGQLCRIMSQDASFHHITWLYFPYIDCHSVTLLSFFMSAAILCNLRLWEDLEIISSSVPREMCNNWRQFPSGSSETNAKVIS